MGLRELLERSGFITSGHSPEKGGNVAPPSGPSSSPSGAFLSNIYRQNDIPIVPFTAEQALDLLGSWLRAETRHPTFIGLLKEENPTSPEAVTEDARRKVDALNAAAGSLPGEFADFIENTKRDIAKLEVEIQERREAVERAQVEGEQIAQLCLAEAERLNTLLKFLS